MEQESPVRIPVAPRVSTFAGSAIQQPLRHVLFGLSNELDLRYPQSPSLRLTTLHTSDLMAPPSQTDHLDHVKESGGQYRQYVWIEFRLTTKRTFTCRHSDIGKPSGWITPHLAFFLLPSLLPVSIFPQLNFWGELTCENFWQFLF